MNVVSKWSAFFKGGILEFYVKEINSQMLCQMVFDKLRARNNTQDQNVSLRLEVNSLKIDDFVVRHRVENVKGYFLRVV